MKAAGEVGTKKVISFVTYSFLQTFYNLLFLPPLRSIFLEILGAKIQNESIIMGVKFFNWHHKGPKWLTIGADCFIGDETLIDLYNFVTLEDQVTLGQRVLVLTHTNVGYADHPLQKHFPKTSKGVTFRRGCFVGAGSIILPGVTIGEKSFIAAGSVVTEDVPRDSVYAGVPAKLLRKL